MSFAQGTSESLISGWETSYKVMPGTVLGDKLSIANPQFKPMRNKFSDTSLTGVRQPRPVVFGKIPIDFSFDLNCNPSSVLPLFRGLLGMPVTAGGIGATPLYAQQYGFGTLLPMYFSQRHTDINQYLLFNGCYLNQCSFTIGAEGLVAAKTTGIGALVSIASSDYITGAITDRTGYDPFSALYVRVKQGGTVIGYSKQVDLTIDNKIGKEFAQDQSTGVAVVFGEIPLVTGKMMTLFQDATQLTMALAGNDTSVEIWLPYANGYGLLFELPTVKFQPGVISTNGTGMCSAELQFDAQGKAGVSQIPGRNRSRYISATSFPALSALTLIMAPDGGAGQTFTFQSGDNTIDLVAARINATATGMTASVERKFDDLGGVLRIDSNTKGPASSIQVTGGTANTSVLLAFDTALHSGLDNQALYVTALSPNAS